MIKVGLTGNIGSGKSTVARVFKILGIKVYTADDEAKTLLKKPNVIQEIVQMTGTKVLDKNKQIDRKKLAKMVFGNPEMLKQLNQIIHPRIREDFQLWLTKNKTEKYIVQEAAILFESGFDKMFNKIIFVSAPEDLRIERILKRDKVEVEAVLSRIKNQQSETEKIHKSDYIILNDGGKMIIPQIIEIHQQLLKFSQYQKK
jgi:dephospho-CoA kinase